MDFIFNARRVSMGFFKNRLNNRFLVPFNSSRFLMASIGVSCIRITPFQKRKREASFGTGREKYLETVSVTVGSQQNEKGPSPSGGTGIAIILLDFVLVNMEAAGKRKNPPLALAEPRYPSGYGKSLYRYTSKAQTPINPVTHHRPDSWRNFI